MNTKIETTGGRFFDYANPQAKDVHVVDIARALARQARYNGLVDPAEPLGYFEPDVFYSVAEHALLVRQLVIAQGRPDLGYAALHHDSEETYLGDIPKPLKPFLGEPFQELRGKVDAVVAEALGADVDDFDHPAVKLADRVALRIESHYLKPSRGLAQEYGLDGDVPPLPEGWRVDCLSPADAERRFLMAHWQEVAGR